MKRSVLEFLRRGLTVCGFGPLVLAVLYLIFDRAGVIESLSINEVCIGIFSLTGLAFIAGGMNVIYQVERLPLMLAILIHGAVLYAAYLATYLINGWLELGLTPVLVFSGIFVFGYLVIWVLIYLITKKSTTKLNEKLSQRQYSAE